MDAATRFARAFLFPPPPMPPFLLQDPGIGRQALAKCADKLPMYTACAEKHLTAKQKSTWAAPQHYTQQLGGAGGSGGERSEASR